MNVRVARSARKHSLSVGRIRSALTNATLTTVVDDAEYWIGTTHDGFEVEMVLVPDDRNPDDRIVIHAMPTSWRRNR